MREDVDVTSEKTCGREEKGGSERSRRSSVDHSVPRGPKRIETHRSTAQMTLGESLRNELAGGVQKNRDYF